MTREVTINGAQRVVDVPVDMPLLWVLGDVLGMTGTKFGCGMALCGACTVQLDGHPIRSCIMPISAVSAEAIRTLETIGETATGRDPGAWIALDVPQCGYCQRPDSNMAAVSIHVTPRNTMPGHALTGAFTIESG